MISETHLEDCMIGMARYPDKFFDLAIVDPPYGIGVFTTPKHTDSNGKRIVNKKKFKDDYTWNKDIPDKEYFLEVERISKRRIIWGANFYNCFTGGGVVWYKGEQTKTISACEIASVSGQNKVDYVHINWQSGFFRKAIDGDTIHPCQKPIKLYRWLLKNYAKPGDKILDTHMGSQSSRIAAYDMGFDFYGWEIDEDYFKKGNQRYNNHIKQLTMFK